MPEMTNKIIDAISVSLNEEFGDGYEIHMEEMQQDLEEPCFFISSLEPTSSLYSGKRRFRENQFCIQYFPETDEKQRECNGIAERMLQCLEYIKAEGEDRPMRGTKMKYGVVDGILNFFVSYNCFTYTLESQQPPMEEFETSTSTKEGE